MSNVKQYAEVIQDLSQNVPSFNFKGFSICLFDEIVKKLPYRLEYDYFAFNGTYDELVKQVYLKVSVLFITLVCCSSLQFLQIIDNKLL